MTQTSSQNRPSLRSRVHGAPLLGKLGPGLITGAADDDPSGIATYSQGGAQFGYGLLWTLVLTFPLMVAIQMVSALIGRVTGHGLARNMGDVLPPRLVGLLVARAERGRRAGECAIHGCGARGGADPGERRLDVADKHVGARPPAGRHFPVVEELTSR